jgi:hypothetical protein
VTARCRCPRTVASVFVVQGSQGMGHESLNITLTNISGHSCTVYGFPGLKLLGEDQEDQPGAGQATTVTWDPAVAKKLITLADTGSASTTVRFDDDVPTSNEPQSGACEPTSYYVEVTAPDETTRLVQKIGGPNSITGVTVCEHGALDVLAFVPGSVGANQ